MARCLHRFRLASFAALLATLAVAAAPPTFANPSEPQENSLHAALERLASTLKAESERAMAAAAQAVQENRGTLADANARVSARIASWREKLSGQKDRLATMARDAAASLDTWTQAAAMSWLRFQRSTVDALDRLQDWMQKQSGSDPETPV
jgi:hypothetical protein